MTQTLGVIRTKTRSNTAKTKLMIIDGIASNRNVPVRVEYNNIPLDVTPETETVRYLGFWVTPNGNMRVAMDLVVERTFEPKKQFRATLWDPDRCWRSL